MSKVQVDAVKRDFMIKPRLEYRTLQGVNGPLVILEVRATTPSAVWHGGFPMPPVPPTALPSC